MNFISKLKSISDQFVFFEIKEEISLGIISLSQGFIVPLSTSSIDKVREENIDLNLISLLLNMSYVICMDQTSSLSQTYIALFHRLYESDDEVVKSILKDVDFESHETLAYINGIAISTGDIYFYNLLGRALLNQYINSEDVDMLGDALEAFDASLEIYDDAEAYYYLSFIMSEKEEYQAAYDCAKKALENNPPDSIKEALEDGMDIIRDRSDIERAGMLLHQNEFEEAKTLLEECSSQTDDLWEKHLYLGEVYAVENSMPQSISHFKKALELNPSNPEIYSSLGLVSVMVGDYLKAKEIFEAGIKLEPLNTDLLKNLALLYMRISKQELAHDIMENVLKIDPEDEEAKVIFEEIKEKLSENQ